MPKGVARGSLKVYSTPSKEFQVYAYGDAITTLFPDLTEATRLGQSEGTVSYVRAHIVKRYPGDTGYTVAAHSRQNYVNRGRPGTSTTPGKRFWIETATVVNGKTHWKAHQFTYTGSWIRMLSNFISTPTKRIRRESSRVVEVQPQI